MQRTLIIIIALVVGAGAILTGVLWFSASDAPNVNTKQPGTSTGNTGTTVVTPGGTISSAQERTVSTLDGKTLQVNDFKKNPLTVEDTNNKDHFYLSGGF